VLSFFSILIFGDDPMRLAAIIVTLSLLSVPAAAADVYRTVDAQGNIVYSDRPEDGSSVRVAVASTSSRAPVREQTPRNTAAPSPSPAAAPDETTIAAAERAQLAEDRAANCAIARERNETYATSHRLYRVGDDGERIYYNNAELSQVRMDAEAEVARWCN
jgi:hypothetical protein